MRWLFASYNWKLLVVMDAGFIGALKLALTLVKGAIPPAAFGGFVAVTVGGVVEPWGTKTRSTQ